MNESAPKSLRTGSQVLEVRKPSPNSDIAGQARAMTFQTIAPSRTTADRAAARVIPRRATSPIRSLSRRREARSEYSEGTAATGKRNPKQGLLSTGATSPPRNHNFTFQHPSGYTRAGRLGAIEPNRNQGEESHVSRKTLALLGALIIATLALASVAGATSSKSNAGTLTGAGSSFVSKLVQTWIPKVDAKFGLKVTYVPIGSGGGINAITGRTVDFGASDA